MRDYGSSDGPGCVSHETPNGRLETTYGGRGQKSCNCQGLTPHSLKWQGRCTATSGGDNYRVLQACHALTIALKPCQHY
jgi:hypothetical protein